MGREGGINSPKRFSLLLLEHGEVLFESVAAYDTNSRYDGRLWICSKGVFFEPKVLKKPIQKFRFADMKSLPILRHDDPSSSTAVCFQCSRYTSMKESGHSTPYRIVSVEESQGSCCYRLPHAKQTFLSTLLSLLITLWQSEHSNGRDEVDKICANRLKEQKFDRSRLNDFREKMVTPRPVQVSVVSKFIDSPGCIVITNKRLYFQPAQLNNIGQVVKSYQLNRLETIYRRRYMLQQCGLELCFSSNTKNYKDEEFESANLNCILFAFENIHERDAIYDILISHPQYAMERKKTQLESLENATKRWQKRELSNYGYLSFLNTLADRSTNDLTQYPVFPWIISDYTSDILDLQDRKTFRDLTKPIGALNEERLKSLKERYHHMKSDPDSPVPPFLYGTHYSTPGYVLYYLVRQSPDLMLRLQNGKFDHPDRSFNSIAGTWSSVLSNPADLKELVPQFFDSDGEFLVNSKRLDLGRKQNGDFVDDVTLPPWAKSPLDFITKNREALESEYVSENLHNWIDLVFGYKQRGENALEADNLFYYLTYEGAVDIDKIKDKNEKNAIQVQIYEFGQTPKQLFIKPHVGRNSQESPLASLSLSNPEKVLEMDSVKPPSPEPKSQRNKNEHSENISTPTENNACMTNVILKDKNETVENDYLLDTKTLEDKLNHLEKNEALPELIKLSTGSLESEALNENNELPHIDKPNLSVKPCQEGKRVDSIFDSSESAALTSPTVFYDKEKVEVNSKGLATRESSSTLWETNTYQNTFEILEPLKTHRKQVSGICRFSGAGDPRESPLFSVSHDASLSFITGDHIKRRVNIGRLALSSCKSFGYGDGGQGCGKVAIGSWDNSLYIYSVEYGRLLERVSGHDDAVACIDTNKLLLTTGSWDSTVKIWDMGDGEIGQRNPIHTVLDHDTAVTSLEFSSTGNLIISGSSEGVIIVNDLRIGDMIFEVPGEENDQSKVIGANWLKHENSISCSFEDGTVKVFDVRSGLQEPLNEFTLGTNGLITSSSIAANRKRAILGNDVGELTMCDLDSIRNESKRSMTTVKIRENTGAPVGITSLESSSEDGSLCIGYSDGMVQRLIKRKKDE